MPTSDAEKAAFWATLDRLRANPVLMDQMVITSFAKIEFLPHLRASFAGRLHLAQEVEREAQLAVQNGVPGAARIFDPPRWFEVVRLTGDEINKVEALRRIWAERDKKELTRWSDRGEAESLVALGRDTFANAVLVSDDHNALAVDGVVFQARTLRVRSTVHVMVLLVMDARVTEDEMWAGYLELVNTFGLYGLRALLPPDAAGRATFSDLVRIADQKP